MPKPPPDRTRKPLATAIVAEAVRRLEQGGPLDDAAALPQALRSQPTRAAQLGERAWLLGERLGLPHELARWRVLAFWAVLLLAVGMTLGALMTARSVLAPDRSINAAAAFVALLGWHVLALLAWLGGLLWRGKGAGDLSLGRAALALAARAPFDKGEHALLLLRSTAAVLRRARLWPWLTGWISHVVWTLSFVAMLVVLGVGFSFWSYRLTWETTILSAGFFERFIAVTGALPALLGFAVPDVEAVQQVGNVAAQANAVPRLGNLAADAPVVQQVADAAAGAAAMATTQSAWAWWLIGCVVAYGLLPRVLLAAVSYGCWRLGQGRLAAPDMDDPYVHGIYARLDALEPPPEVIDPERRPRAAGAADRAHAPGAPDTLVLIGFELPPEMAWPPAGLPAATTTLRVSGSAAERQAAISTLLATRPMALLVATHAESSPDRGTARFLREAATFAARTALLPYSTALAAPAAAQRRWREWLEAEGLSALTLIDGADAARDWVAATHE